MDIQKTVDMLQNMRAMEVRECAICNAEDTRDARVKQINIIDTDNPQEQEFGFYLCPTHYREVILNGMYRVYKHLE